MPRYPREGPFHMTGKLPVSFLSQYDSFLSQYDSFSGSESDGICDRCSYSPPFWFSPSLRFGWSRFWAR